MNPPASTCRIDVKDLVRTTESYMDRFHDLASFYRFARRRDVTDFLSHAYDLRWNTAKAIVLTERQVMYWVKRTARRFNAETAVRRLVCVDRFAQHLVSRSVASSNPFTPLRERWGARGWRGIVEALKQPNPCFRLQRLRPLPMFRGQLGAHARDYLELHRAAGAKLAGNGLILSAFNHFACRRGLSEPQEISSGLLMEWAHEQTCRQDIRRRKLLRLRQFFDYLVSLRVVPRNPVTLALVNSWRAKCGAFRPHIYTPEEIMALLRAAEALQSDRWFKMKADFFSMLIGLLYPLGLRVGEALRLQIGDIDFCHRTLFIRQTKFFKDRLLPFGPRLAQRLERFLEARRRFFGPAKEAYPLLVARDATVVRVTKVDKFFPHLLAAAGIQTRPNERRPRLHDFRHAFAVHRLLRWYREGDDVQSKLVLLSTFMGHAGIESTQLYLTITDSLLEQANGRFFRSFGHAFT